MRVNQARKNNGRFFLQNPLMRLRRAGLASALVLVALGLSACSASYGTSDKIDHAKAEKLLEDNLKPKPRSVSCPTGVKIVEGGTFDCKVVLADGRTATVTIHMTSSTGDVHVANKDIHVG